LGIYNEKSAFPLDKKLNLANRKFSDGVAQRVAIEAAKNSFDDTVESINTTTGATITINHRVVNAQLSRNRPRTPLINKIIA